MLLKVQREELKEFDIEFPAYYKMGEWDYYLIKSPDKILNIFANKDLVSTSTGTDTMRESTLARILDKGTRTTEAEFGKALIAHANMIAEFLDSDPLRQIICNARVEYTGPSIAETLMGHFKPDAE